MENTGTQAPAVAGGYGYAEHVQKESALVFGLNAGNVRLTKFAHTMNGGKDGAEMEALEITFTIDGTEKSYRKFPVKKAFTKDSQGNQIEVTDPAHEAMGAAKQELSATLVHIVGAFNEPGVVKAALGSRVINSFKDFCNVLVSLLPANHADIALDAFCQYQWQISGEAKITFLEFPKNMKHGRWLGRAIVPKDKWEKQVKVGASNSEIALRYVDADGNVHPFKRNGWFMESNFAIQQKEAPTAGGAAMNSGSSAPAAGATSGDW